MLSTGVDHIEIKVIDKIRLNNWIDVYCRSFDSLHIKDEVTTIISKHYKKLTLLVAHYCKDEIRILRDVAYCMKKMIELVYTVWERLNSSEEKAWQEN